jgi:hypothetical protein
MNILEALDSLRGMANNARPRGVGPGQGYRVDILHEIAHFVTLGKTVTDKELREIALGSININDVAINMVDELDWRAADWNEIKTVACEIHVLRRAGVTVDVDRYLTWAANNSRWEYFNAESALALLRATLETKTARSNATRCVAELRRIVRRLRVLDRDLASGALVAPGGCACSECLENHAVRWKPLRSITKALH